MSALPARRGLSAPISADARWATAVNLWAIELDAHAHMDLTVPDAHNAFAIVTHIARPGEKFVEVNDLAGLGQRGEVHTKHVGLDHIQQAVLPQAGRQVPVQLDHRQASEALDQRLGQGRIDEARVDIKRTHEREAVIAEFRSKETQSTVDEAKGRGVQAQGREINGYPVELLDEVERVLGLQLEVGDERRCDAWRALRPAVDQLIDRLPETTRQQLELLDAALAASLSTPSALGAYEEALNRLEALPGIVAALTDRFLHWKAEQRLLRRSAGAMRCRCLILARWEWRRLA